MRRALFLGVVVFLALLPAAAQEEPPANLSRGYHFVVKDGHGAQFEAAFKQHIEWRASQNDAWGWEVWQLEVGERLGRYVAISGGHRWEDLDAYSIPGALENWQQTAGPHVQQVDSWMDRMMIRGSRPPEGELQPGAIAEVIDYKFKPGKMEAAVDTIVKVTEAANQSNWEGRYIWLAPAAGGESNILTLVLPGENWAAMRGPEKNVREMMVEALGEEAAGKLMKTFGDAVESSSTSIWRYRADLSYQPGGGM